MANKAWVLFETFVSKGTERIEGIALTHEAMWQQHTKRGKYSDSSSEGDDPPPCSQAGFLSIGLALALLVYLIVVVVVFAGFVHGQVVPFRVGSAANAAAESGAMLSFKDVNIDQVSDQPQSAIVSRLVLDVGQSVGQLFRVVSASVQVVRRNRGFLFKSSGYRIESNYVVFKRALNAAALNARWRLTAIYDSDVQASTRLAEVGERAFIGAFVEAELLWPLIRLLSVANADVGALGILQRVGARLGSIRGFRGSDQRRHGESSSNEHQKGLRPLSGVSAIQVKENALLRRVFIGGGILIGSWCWLCWAACRGTLGWRHGPLFILLFLGFVLITVGVK